MSDGQDTFAVVVVGAGHAGVEAAWAAANALASAGAPVPSVALATFDKTTIGAMSCNPAIGGLAKGQLVREIDALGGLMGLAADATGIQFKVLNRSKGAAVWGPRCQSDRHAYASFVRSSVESRPEITIVQGSVERIVVKDGRVGGVVARAGGIERTIRARGVVVTSGTFMRGLMHCGESRTEGGRHGEASATGLSGSLAELGFELGRLKTGTPPRLRRGSIDWDRLEPALGDAEPEAFSDLAGVGAGVEPGPFGPFDGVLGRFPAMEQVECRQTCTTREAHALIRANLHRAPMFSGQIEGVGPRYCPSIEDKVVRFAERESHGVFLEPESLRSDWVYCNGISTSLPPDVQDQIVHAMPGCSHAEILRYGYAVEYDVVRPHQIRASCASRSIQGLFFAGQVNGTSGYEEAAAQGVVAGVNAARFALGDDEWTIARDEAYIGVLMDDLVTKTPVEPYRMFTSRAEHRLLLRADSAPDRLTPTAERLGLLGGTALGRLRRRMFEERRRALDAGRRTLAREKVGGRPVARAIESGEISSAELDRMLGEWGVGPVPRGVCATLHAETRYAGYLARESAEIRRRAGLEHRRLPHGMAYWDFPAMRAEARQALARFRPETFGQASRLEGVTPADLTLLAVLVGRGAD